MKLEIPKEWFKKRIELESDYDISADSPFYLATRERLNTLIIRFNNLCEESEEE